MCVYIYVFECVSYTSALVESRPYDDDDDGYGAEIGDFHARGPT